MDSDEELDMGDSPGQSLDLEKKSEEVQPQEGMGEEQKEEDVGEVQSLNSYIGPIPSAPELFSRPHIKKQLKFPRPAPAPAPSGLPLVTPDTIRTDTYDLDFLQDPRTQKRLEAGHRFLGQTPFHVERHKSLTPGTDYILRNIVSAGEKSSVKATLEVGSSAGILMSARGKKGSVDVQRLLEFRTQAELKRERLVKEMEKKETAECSFRPTILPNAAKKPNRDIGVYYQDMLDYQKNVEDKVQSKKAKKESALQQEVSGYFRPSLCPKSREMDTAVQSPRFERLYKMHKEKLQNLNASGEDTISSTDTSTSADTLFRPAINQQSRKLVRPLPVAQHLYQEAKVRAERMRSQTWSPKKQETLISAGSQAMLVGRLRSELIEKWKVFEPDRKDISYMKFVKLLAAMHLISNQLGSMTYEQERTQVLRAWTECGGEDDNRVTQKKVEEFLLIILHISDQREGNGKEERPESLERASHLRSLFSAFYNHRLERTEEFPLRSAFRGIEEFPFHPTINEEPVSFRGGRSVIDILWEDARQRKERKAALKSQIEAVALKECVFTPVTNSNSEKYIGKVASYTRDCLSQSYMKLRESTIGGPGWALYQLASVAQEKKKQAERSPDDIETERNIAECTFAPDLSLTREGRVSGRVAESKGADITVNRLKKAREDAQRVKVMTERGYVHKEDLPTFYFTRSQPPKLGNVFDPSKAPEKKVGKPGRKHITVRSKVVLTPTPKTPVSASPDPETPHETPPKVKTPSKTPPKVESLPETPPKVETPPEVSDSSPAASPTLPTGPPEAYFLPATLVDIQETIEEDAKEEEPVAEFSETVTVTVAEETSIVTQEEAKASE